MLVLSERLTLALIGHEDIGSPSGTTTFISWTYPQLKGYSVSTEKWALSSILPTESEI